MRVLILGAAGRVGQVLTRVLSDEYDFVLADVRPLDDPRYLPLDVLDADAVAAAVADCDAVVYLSIARAEDLGHGTHAYAQRTVDIHVKGTLNVLHAAVQAGGKRVLYAGTVSSLEGYAPHVLVRADDPPRGGGIYGITKGFGEQLCGMYHESAKLPVAILRLGHVYIEEIGGKRGQVADRYLVHQWDVAQAFSAVVRNPWPPFAVIHVVSDSVGRRWDLETGERLYGWRPWVRFLPGGTPDPATLPG